MTNKADYTETEWKVLLDGLLNSGLIIIGSEVSIGSFFRGEILFEMAAMLKKIVEGIDPEKDNDLLVALWTEFGEKYLESKEKKKDENVSLAEDGRIEKLKEAAAILDKKATPQEATEVKSFWYEVAYSTANAVKEGGFMGFGGKQISDKEAAAIAKIKEALGIQ